MSEPDTARSKPKRPSPGVRSAGQPRDEPHGERLANKVDVHVENRQRRLSLDLHWLQRELVAVACREGLQGRRLSVVLVSDQRMRQLNRDFRGHDERTDVLAFDYGASSHTDDVDGEVVVSAQTAQSEARRRGVPAVGEVLLYCVHGFLHLAGYDDSTAAGRRRMWQRQLAHLREAGLPAELWQKNASGRDSRAEG